jgi:signal transduction histidine kinase
MRLHDGELTVESEPGKGTTAILSLPVTRATPV